MHRTRAALLDAAEHCVARYGARRTTMGDVALKAAVAKATLYNHFRTKDDLLAGLVHRRLEELAVRCCAEASAGLAAVLVLASAAVSGAPALRRVATDEPALVARLLTGDQRSARMAEDAVRSVLAAAGATTSDDAVELVLRWLLSQVLWPAGPDAAGAQAERLAATLDRPAGRRLESAPGSDRLEPA